MDTAQTAAPTSREEPQQQPSTMSQHETSAQESSSLQWQPTDSTFLNPTTLHIPRVQRAWDRQPSSPFSRQRLRVGKVWKRPTKSSLPSSQLSSLQRSNASLLGDAAINDHRIAKRARTRFSLTNGSTPKKPVKKMRFDSLFGPGARVAVWEAGGESPVRKIVTRSRKSADGEIIALADEGEGVEVIEGDDGAGNADGEELELEEGDEEDLVEEEDEGDVAIKIVNEDGTVVEANVEDVAADDEWEDEGVQDLDEDIVDEIEDGEGTVEESDSTAQDTTNAVPEDLGIESPASDAVSNLDESKTSGDALPNGQDAEETMNDEDAPVQDQPALETNDALTESASTDGMPSAQPNVVLSGPPEVILPEGFVSPVKRRSRVGRAARQSNSRRRTLPIQFAPVTLPELNGEITVDSEIPEQPEVDQSEDAGATYVETSSMEQDAEPADQITYEDGIDTGLDSVPEVEDAEQDDEWEDIDDTPAPEEVAPGGGFGGVRTSDKEDADIGLDDAEVEQPLSAPSMHETIAEQADEVASSLKIPLLSPAKTPSSPIPSIEHRHPRLPLRRSPRRQSSSPLKQSTIWSADEKPHHVAFTPIKNRAMDATKDELLNEDRPILTPLLHDTVMVERSMSAPPEEAQMSPQKVSKPRLSDDTALLQAFLSRAAESKGERRLSVTGRESISNRRDSDTVRQALASPARAEVLFDLDPNSPVARKTPAASNADLDTESIASSALKNDDSNDLSDDNTLPRTRRSGRSSRRVQVATQNTPAPNKISIRGNTENVVLKRSEAQEVALLTRTNTRRNKGGAIMPNARLAKLALSSQSQSDDTTVDDSLADAAKKGTRNITWAETLVEFYQGGEIAETSFMSTDAEPAADTKDDATLTDIAVPPPSETPSKPKIRRLKPARATASTPAKATIAEPSSTTAPENDKVAAQPEALPSEPEPKPRPTTKRQSRIATPGKALSNASLLPADLTPAPPAPGTNSAPPPTTTRRKPPVSKLPAPSTSSVSKGKENLIASSPKKKPAVSTTTVKGFAPKFDFNLAKPKFEQPGSQAVNSQQQQQQGNSMPGLMSPAKKGGRRPAFAGATAGTEESSGLGKREEMPPGLSSPAKKRTRRMGFQ